MFSTNNIKKIRMDFNKDQYETAKMLNVSRSSYAMWESNNEIIPIKRLLDFCDVFHCSLDFALGLTDVNQEVDEKIDLNKFKERLKLWRKENNMTQEKLAKNLNTTKTVISGYEIGRYLIATPFLYDICKKYKISADYLLGRVDDSKYLK